MYARTIYKTSMIPSQVNEWIDPLVRGFSAFFEGSFVIKALQKTPAPSPGDIELVPNLRETHASVPKLFDSEGEGSLVFVQWSAVFHAASFGLSSLIFSAQYLQMTL